MRKTLVKCDTKLSRRNNGFKPIPVGTVVETVHKGLYAVVCKTEPEIMRAGRVIIADVENPKQKFMVYPSVIKAEYAYG